MKIPTAVAGVWARQFGNTCPPETRVDSRTPRLSLEAAYLDALLNQSFGILKLNAQTGQNRYRGFQRRLPLGYFPDILLDISGRFIISNTSQKQALKNYRKRLHQRGMARFEVLGLNADRELIRSLAKRLADKDPEATRIRTAVRRTIAGGPPKKGGILDALRRSPLVGAGLDLTRPLTAARKVAL